MFVRSLQEQWVRSGLARLEAITDDLAYSQAVIGAPRAAGRSSVFRICLELPPFVLSAVLVALVALVVGFWPWELW